jgi:hypothetical protein
LGVVVRLSASGTLDPGASVSAPPLEPFAYACELTSAGFAFKATV